MNKEAVVHICNGILLSHKNKHIWVSSNEVDEPRAHYAELSKSEKQLSYTSTYIWNLERWYWWNYLQGSNGDIDIESTVMNMMQGEEGEGGMCAESNMGNYITTCKIESQREFAEWLREHKLGLCIHLEGWDGEEGERERTHIYLWLIHADVWQKPTQFCKTITLQLKSQLKILKEKKKC